MNLLVLASLLLSIALSTWAGELRSLTFEMPSLVIQVDQVYLVKKMPTILTCQLTPGWSAAEIVSIAWMKNGEPFDFASTTITRRAKEDEDEDVKHEGTTLTVVGGKSQSEGDYQCLAEVTKVRLSNGQVIATRLVSPPVKLRRARVTKFEKAENITVIVRQGEVARLPCLGLPDVIPGPPEICFIKENSGSEFCYGLDPGDPNYLSTPTGLQIALMQEEFAGYYACVVRNDYTNQTKRAPHIVHLIMSNTTMPTSSEAPELQPALVYPTGSSSIDKPVAVDVAYGADAILECVITGAKIAWVKFNDTTPEISLTDEDARVRQHWGNLRIRQVTQEDAGIYSCHGFSPLDTELDFEAPGHPVVYYALNVHAPTDVILDLNQNPMDRSWQLSCLAKNHRYEIPMVFVNGTALIDVIAEMGVASSTDFYTNPINVTMQVKNSFSGSVQCISRPAMDEAEVYGNGLERGHSMNIFVMSSEWHSDDLISTGPDNQTVYAGMDVSLPCVVHKTRGKYWMKDGDYVQIFKQNARTQIKGSNTLVISRVQEKDEGWYSCVVKGEENQMSKASAYLKVLPATAQSTTIEPFHSKRRKDEPINFEGVRGFVAGSNVRVQWAINGTQEAYARIAQFRVDLRREGNTAEQWLEADRVAPHVRATTIKDLIPKNKYQFRVVLIRDDQSTVKSKETVWMMVEQPTGDVAPVAPVISFVRAISPTSARISWTHVASMIHSKARNFYLIYRTVHQQDPTIMQVDGNSTEAILKKLQTQTTYSLNIMAENLAGKSPTSATIVFNTEDMESDLGFFSWFSDISMQTIILVLTGILLSLLVLLICCVVFCSIRSGKSTKVAKSANGKFLDTSYRIFNEQKVHKSRLYNDTNNLFSTDGVDECSPLKFQRSDDKDSVKSEKFTVPEVMPNFYGNNENVESSNQAEAPCDPTYVSTTKITSNGIYGTPTARCYSPDSGTSHEMLMPYNGGTLTSSMLNSSPLMTSSPQRVMAYKCPDSLLYSPAGTATSIPDTNSGHMARLTCDSPTNPPTDSSDQGVRCGGSSRNSQISSTEGAPKYIQMATFKSNSPNTTSFIGGTFDRRREQLTE